MRLLKDLTWIDPARNGNGTHEYLARILAFSRHSHVELTSSRIDDAAFRCLPRQASINESSTFPPRKVRLIGDYITVGVKSAERERGGRDLVLVGDKYRSRTLGWRSGNFSRLAVESFEREILCSRFAIRTSSRKRFEPSGRPGEKRQPAELTSPSLLPARARSRTPVETAAERDLCLFFPPASSGKLAVELSAKCRARDSCRLSVESCRWHFVES
jgi:hypothetical protein